ncbi:MAG: hypothetical protein KC877_02025 [Candidatus Kaiserbacteria bacterium]|nr:hypothetical protein [Candidatus Kaiserbacteria bacterium]MCB9816187.1 hypothetical protein [Candidatus Nomurabacteria bacterium]
MTAFNDVMTAEAEAAQAIEAAKEAATAALATAESDRRSTLETLEGELKQVEEAERAINDKQVAATVTKITAAAEAEVADVRQKFAAKKGEVTTLLKQRFQ